MFKKLSKKFKQAHHEDGMAFSFALMFLVGISFGVYCEFNR